MDLVERVHLHPGDVLVVKGPEKVRAELEKHLAGRKVVVVSGDVKLLVLSAEERSAQDDETAKRAQAGK